MRPSDDPRPPASPRRRRLRRAALVLLAAPAAVVLALWLLREPVVHPLLGRAARALLAGRGVELELADLESDWWSGARVEGLALAAPERGFRLTVAEARVEASPLGLVRGGLAGIERVSGRGAALELDLGARARRPSRPPGAPRAALPPRLPALDLEQVDLRIGLGGGRVVRVEDATVRAAPAPGGTLLRVASPAASLAAPEGGPSAGDPLPLVAEVRWDAGRLEVVGPTGLGEVLRLLPGASLDLRPADARTSFDVEAEAFGGSLAVRGAVREGATTLAAEAAGVRLGSLAARLPVDLGELAGLRGTLARLAADVTIPRGDPLALAGTAEVEVASLVLLGREVDVLRASARAADRRLAEGDLFLESGANRLTVTDLALPLAAGAWRAGETPVSGRVALDARSLPELLERDPARPLPEHRLVLEGRAEDGGLVVESGALETPGGSLRIAEARLEPAQAEDGGRTWRLAAELALDFVDLAPLGVIAGEAPWSGELHGAVSVAGLWPALAARASLGGERLVVAGTPVGSASVEARLDGPVDAPDELTGRADLALGPLVVAGRRVESATARLVYDRGVLRVPELVVAQGPNRLLARLERLPLEQGFPRALADARGSLSLSVSDLPALLGATPPPAPKGRSDRVPPHQLDLSGRIASGRLLLDQGRLATPQGALEIERTEVVLARSGAPESLAAAAVVDFDDLAPLGRVLGSDGWAGALEGALEVTGPLDGLRGAADLHGAGVVVAGVPLGEVSVRGTLDEEELRVESFDALSGDDELAASGTWRIAARELVDVEATARVADLARYLPGLFRGGSLELAASLAGDLRAPSGSVVLHGSLQPTGALPLELRDVRLALDGADGRYRIEEALARAGGASVRLAGALAWRPDERAASLALDALALERGPLALALEEPATLAVSPERVEVTPLALSGSGGRLALRAEAARDPVAPGLGLGDARAHVEMADCDLLAILEPWMPEGFAAGGADLVLDVERAGGALALASEGAWGGVVPAPGVAPVDLAWDVRLAEGVLAVRRLAVESADLSLALDGTAPLAPGARAWLAAGPVDARLALEVRRLAGIAAALLGEGSLEGAGRVTAEVGGTWRALEGTLELEATGLAWRGAGAVPALVGPGAARARVVAGGGEAALDFALELPGVLEGDGAGRARLPLDVAGWLAGARPAPEEVPIEGRVDLVAPDLSSLSAVPGVRRVAGRLEAEATVSGTLAEPVPGGRLALAQGELKLATNLPAFSELAAEMVWRDERLVIERFEGELGGAPVALGGTVAVLDGEPIVEELLLTGTNLLLYRERGVLLRADADLRLTGSLDDLLVDGDAVLRNSRYTKDIDLLGGLAGGERAPSAPQRGIPLFSLEGGLARTMRFDVRVTSAEPIRVANNLVSGSLRPDLVLGGTGLVPRIVGLVYVDATRVKLPTTTVTVESGTITFLREDPYVPVLALQATTRMRGYDITIAITGPYDEPEIHMTSVPPLRGDDLLYLVATGKPPEEGLSQETGVDAAQSAAAFLAQDLFQGWFGGGADGEEGFFDRLEITTGRDVSKSGVENIEVTFRLARNVLVERDAAYVAVERDVHEDYNLGLRLVFRFGGE